MLMPKQFARDFFHPRVIIARGSETVSSFVSVHLLRLFFCGDLKEKEENKIFLSFKIFSSCLNERKSIELCFMNQSYASEIDLIDISVI